MGKKIFVFCILLSSVFFTTKAYAFLEGPVAARTGAPEECGSLTCNAPGCHSSFILNTGSAVFSIEVPPTYEKDKSMDIFIKFEDSDSGLHGFELTALDASETKVGTFTSTDNTTQTEAYNNQYAAHTPIGTAQDSWTVQWTAPGEDVPDPITFYAAGNEADGSGDAFGDYIYTTTASAVVTSATPAPEPTPRECEADSMCIDSRKLVLQEGESGSVTVTLQGDNCNAEGITVEAKIRRGKKRITLSSKSVVTDENGDAQFTVTAQKKSGKAKVIFKASGLKAKLKVKLKTE